MEVHCFLTPLCRNLGTSFVAAFLRYYRKCGNSSTPTPRKYYGCLDCVRDAENSRMLCPTIQGKGEECEEIGAYCKNLDHEDVCKYGEVHSGDQYWHLGEAFIPPDEISMTDVAGKVKDIQSLLQNVTKDDFKSIPVMTDATKLNAMQIMALLCSYAHMAKSIILPYLSYRMIELTKQYGMCDDAIVGLAVTGFALISLANDIQLGYNVGKIAEFLAEESPNRHNLRVRISFVWDGNTKLFVEPCQSVFSKIMWVYNSAKLNGDIDTAMVSAMNYCFGMFLTGEKLEKEHLSHHMLNKVMCIYLGYTAFTGVTDEDAVKGFEVKSYDELHNIGVESGDQFLLFHIVFHQILHHCYFREFVDVDRIARANRSTDGPKRLLEVCRTFFEGLSCLCLARQTFQAKYRVIGERAVLVMMSLVIYSRWNFENKLFLLQAELHYLNGEYEKAEASYEASIASARSHRFLNEEAYAYELYGVYLLENRMVDKGHEKLDIAIEKYAEWGALKKVEHVKKFKEEMDPKFLSKNVII
ncbi:predicted protein [Thalassiosira pseudonana CCMP1335]|uniref:Uncharacterized protein n=1 Tax=Thalassiosira pseudonana TaxID=35128 RepID=B8LEH8_THAPS|nr:predicted protein [Thalassiosira pseudonana CCMP1335]EED86246.1 predicted protein [Thalassiosira pseudonana CCMP1335]